MEAFLRGYGKEGLDGQVSAGTEGQEVLLK